MFSLVLPTMLLFAFPSLPLNFCRDSTYTRLDSDHQSSLSVEFIMSVQFSKLLLHSLCSVPVPLRAHFGKWVMLCYLVVVAYALLIWVCVVHATHTCRGESETCWIIDRIRSFPPLSTSQESALLSLTSCFLFLCSLFRKTRIL